MLTFFVELVWLHATLQNPTTRQGRTTSLLIGVCFKFVELWGLLNFIYFSVDTNINIIIFLHFEYYLSTNIAIVRISSIKKKYLVNKRAIIGHTK